jgi:hypothetical protein
LPRSDAFRLAEFVNLPDASLAHPPVAVLVLVRATALGCATRFADLPRSDAVRLSEFVAIPTLLWHICQLLFWFLFA